MTTHLKKNLLATVAIVTVLAFSAPAMAGNHGKGCNKQNKGVGLQNRPMNYSMLWEDPAAIKALGLSDEQVKKIKDLDFAFREKQLPLKADLDKYRLELKKGFATQPVDEASVLKTAKRIAGIKGEMFVQGTEHRLAVEKLLTPDQIQKIKQYKQQRSGKRGGPKGQGNYRRGGPVE